MTNLDLHNAAIRRLERENKALRAALQGFLAEPYGCPFCDSGKLRNPAKGHDADCPYYVAQTLLADTTTPPAYALVPIEDERAAALCEQAAARLRRETHAPASDAVEQLARCAIEVERETRNE